MAPAAMLALNDTASDSAVYVELYSPLLGISFAASLFARVSTNSTQV